MHSQVRFLRKNNFTIFLYLTLSWQKKKSNLKLIAQPECQGGKGYAKKSKKTHWCSEPGAAVRRSTTNLTYSWQTTADLLSQKYVKLH